MATNYTGGQDIIPIILGDVSLPDSDIYRWLAPYRYILPVNPSKEDFLPLLNDIRKRVKYYTTGRR